MFSKDQQHTPAAVGMSRSLSRPRRSSSRSSSSGVIPRTRTNCSSSALVTASLLVWWVVPLCLSVAQRQAGLSPSLGWPGLPGGGAQPARTGSSWVAFASFWAVFAAFLASLAAWRGLSAATWRALSAATWRANSALASSWGRRAIAWASSASPRATRLASPWYLLSCPGTNRDLVVPPQPHQQATVAFFVVLAKTTSSEGSASASWVSRSRTVVLVVSIFTACLLACGLWFPLCLSVAPSRARLNPPRSGGRAGGVRLRHSAPTPSQTTSPSSVAPSRQTASSRSSLSGSLGRPARSRLRSPLRVSVVN